MVEGDKWEVYIHPELHYRNRGMGKILGGDCVILRTELLQIKGDKKRVHECEPQTRQNCLPSEIAVLDGLGEKPRIQDVKSLISASKRRLDGPLKKMERY